MLNKVILMGRLTADPDFRQTQNGTSMCRFRLAIDRNYSKSSGTDENTTQKQTDFIPVVCWRNTAEFVSRYFHKGSMAIVEGRLENDDYTDQNGVKHYSMQVTAQQVSFGESKKAADASGYGTSNAYPRPNSENAGSSIPPQKPNNTEPFGGMQIGDLSDFEEVLSDGDVPF